MAERQRDFESISNCRRLVIGALHLQPDPVDPEVLIPGYGTTPFDIHDLVSFMNISYLIVEGISLALTIWTIIILVKGVMLIQRFNTGKGILNAILPLLVLIIPILIIVGIAYMA